MEQKAIKNVQLNERRIETRYKLSSSVAGNHLSLSKMSQEFINVNSDTQKIRPCHVAADRLAPSSSPGHPSHGKKEKVRELESKRVLPSAFKWSLR